MTLNEVRLTEDEFEKAFEPLKRDKPSGSDELDVNLITSVYEFIKTLLRKFSMNR